MGILVIGSSNTDMVAFVNHIPVPGETVLGDGFLVNPGGKGANQAVGAARLGKDVTFCCMTGQDDNGRAAKALFDKEGMNTSYVFSTPEKASGVALIAVDEKGENSIVVASGANNELKPSDIDRIDDIGKYSIILTQLETPLDTVCHIGELAGACGVKFVLNPAPARALPEALLKCVDIITPNETEAEIITGIKVDDEASALKSARKLCDMGVKNVIITMGGKGAFVYADGMYETVPAFKVTPVDTTAAGDVFNGALCVALSEGKSLRDAVVFASAAASISVTRAGAQASAPYRDEVDAKLEKNQ